MYQRAEKLEDYCGRWSAVVAIVVFGLHASLRAGSPLSNDVAAKPIGVVKENREVSQLPVSRRLTDERRADAIDSDDEFEFIVAEPLSFPPRYGVSMHPGVPGKPARKQPGDINVLDCPPLRYQLDDCERAGNPHSVAWWAIPSLSKRDSAGMIGGSSPFFGRKRSRQEGIWGLDYSGLLIDKKVWLRWSTSAYQPSAGKYDAEPGARADSR